MLEHIERLKAWQALKTHYRGRQRYLTKNRSQERHVDTVQWVILSIFSLEHGPYTWPS